MKKLVVLTGAGMSAESGLSTFRGSDGLWEKHRIEDVASPEGFAANPELVFNFYNHRRRELLAAKPNEGHIGLARLEKEFDVHIITQNIDNLHEQAGSSHVLHLHGELMKVRSVNHPERIYELSESKCDIHLGDKDPYGDQLRPHIVWFEEMPLYMEQIEEALEQCRVFASIGTSGNVYPAAGFVRHAKAHGACRKIHVISVFGARRVDLCALIAAKILKLFYGLLP